MDLPHPCARRTVPGDSGNLWDMQGTTRANEKWARQDSNLRPTGYEPDALTAELRARAPILSDLLRAAISCGR